MRGKSRRRTSEAGSQASDAPEQSVDRLVECTGGLLGREPGARSNRRAALGSLLEYATGTGVGAVFGALVGDRFGWKMAAPILTGSAVLPANAPIVLLRVTDPRQWSAADWASDILPHAVYGMTAAAVFGTTASGRSRLPLAQRWRPRAMKVAVDFARDRCGGGAATRLATKPVARSRTLIRRPAGSRSRLRRVVR